MTPPPIPEDDSGIEMVVRGPPLVAFGHRANGAQVRAEARIDSPADAEAQGRVRRGHLEHADRDAEAQAALQRAVPAQHPQRIRARLTNPEAALRPLAL